MGRPVGSTNKPKTTKKTKGKVTFKVKCVLCGKEKLPREYYSSSKPEYAIYEGRAPYCRTCIADILYSESGQIDRESFVKVLSYIDKPFVEKEYKRVALVANKNDFLNRYINILNLNYTGMTYADSYRFREDESEIVDKVESDFKVTPQMVTFWGSGYAKKEYEFLQQH